MRVNGDVKQKAVRQGKFKIILLRRPGLRVIGKCDKFGRAHQIKSHVVLHSAHSGARYNHLEYQDENENGGEKSASGRDSQRTENIVEQYLCAVLHAAHAARPIVRM